MTKNMNPNQEHLREEIKNASFGVALSALKIGLRVARKGWNGNDMFLYLVPADDYDATTEAARKEFGSVVPYQSYLALKTVQNDVAVWSASNTDLLAEDWYEVK